MTKELDISRRQFLQKAGVFMGALLLPFDKLNKLIPPDTDFFTEKCKTLLADPSFFTELQVNNTKKIITNQFDFNEYDDLSDNKISHSDTCGLATLATIKKMCGFLYTGIVPNTTIAEIYKKLDGKTFIDVRGRESSYGNGRMIFVGLPDALKLIAPQYIKNTNFLTPNYGSKYSTFVPQGLWLEALKEGEKICEKGGFTLIHCVKHDDGHTILATDIKDGTAIVVDSFEAKAQRVYLGEYFESPGAISMIGVTLNPNLVKVNKFN